MDGGKLWRDFYYIEYILILAIYYCFFMQQNPELYFVTIIGIILGLLLVGFIVTILFLYQRRQRKQEEEMLQMKDSYEKEALLSQLEIQENTFKTIAQELHDNIGQLLSVVKITLSGLPMEKEHKAYPLIVNSQQVLHKAIADLSNLTKSLHTDRIAELGLVESIWFELEAISNARLLKVNFETEGHEYSFDEQTSIYLFRIFQETLNNTLKHAKATTLNVSLKYTDDLFIMSIQDNGIGFTVNEKKQNTTPGSGVGLKSLYNRAGIIGAEISIDSKPGTGTSVLIKLPLGEV
jgi:two-component system, NarL family, sensor kinase